MYSPSIKIVKKQIKITLLNIYGTVFHKNVFACVPVQPAFIRVIDENSKNTLSTGATLGPINEGSTIALYCESGKGKPIPTVEWFKGDKPLEGKICKEYIAFLLK